MIWRKLRFMLLVVVIVVFATFCGLVLTGTMPMEYLDFAVDSRDVVYVSSFNKIFVYDESVFVRTIELQHKTFEFSIDESDNIVLWDHSDMDCIYLYDLYGNLLQTHLLDKNLLSHHSFYKTYGDPSPSEGVFTTSTGKEYRQQTSFFRTKIYCGDNVVYQLPMLDYVMRILMLCAIISLLALVVAEIIIRIRN